MAPCERVSETIRTFGRQPPGKMLPQAAALWGGVKEGGTGAEEETGNVAMAIRDGGEDRIPDLPSPLLAAH